MRDAAGVISVGRLPCQSCYITTKKYPMIPCNEDETLEQLLLHCHWSTEITYRTVSVGITLDCNVESVLYSFFSESLTDSKWQLFGLVVCVIFTHLCKTWAEVVIEQTVITGDTIFKNILTDLRKRKENHQRTGNPLPSVLLFVLFCHNILFA